MLITVTFYVQLTNTIQERHKSNDEFVIIAIGRVGRDFFVKRGMNVVLESHWSSMISHHLLILKNLQVKQLVCSSDGTFDELYMYYNHYVSAIQQDVTRKSSSVNGY